MENQIILPTLAIKNFANELYELLENANEIERYNLKRTLYFLGEPVIGDIILENLGPVKLTLTSHSKTLLIIHSLSFL